VTDRTMPPVIWAKYVDMIPINLTQILLIAAIGMLLMNGIVPPAGLGQPPANSSTKSTRGDPGLMDSDVLQNLS
jgi:hypothetical protein